MTTTEWIGRYNTAFEQADWSARFWDRRHRGGYPSWDKLIEIVHAPSAIQAKECVLSPIDPKEVVDDGQVGQKALNQKESTIIVICSRGREYEMGREEYEGLKSLGMLWEFYPDAPAYWPL